MACAVANAGSPGRPTLPAEHVLDPQRPRLHLTTLAIVAQPQEFIRTPRDAVTIMVLWCVRSGSLFLTLVGVIAVVVTHQFDDTLASRLDTPGELASSLTTPLAGIAAGIVLRALGAALGWLSAAPLVVQGVPPLVPIEGLSRWKSLTDRWRQISATASVRGTWAVRQAAVLTGGNWAKRLRVVDISMRWGSGAAAIALVIIVLTVQL